MRTLSIVSVSGETAGTVELPDEVFDVQANVPLIHQVVVAQQAAARQGTHATRTRGQVRGGGKKPYRQKGTGRARQGSIRAPQYVGGGTVHGPIPRSYRQRTPKKMKAAALRGALSERARHDRVHVVSGFVVGQPRTKDAVAVLSALTGTRRGVGALVVVHRDDELTWLSLRNVPGVRLLAVDQLNTHDVLASDYVVFTEEALAAFLGTGRADPARDEAPRDKATQDETARDKAPRDKAARDKAQDEAPQDEAPQDEAAQDEAVQGKATRDKAAQDKVTRGKAAQGKAAQDKASRDKAAEDKATQDEPARNDASEDSGEVQQ
jgi:large subunit ribosomal protein L4